MNEPSKKPRYSAAILDTTPSTSANPDLAALPISHARSDQEAIDIAVKLATEGVDNGGASAARRLVGNPRSLRYVRPRNYVGSPPCHATLR
jgi:hypothetical protein